MVEEAKDLVCKAAGETCPYLTTEEIRERVGVSIDGLVAALVVMNELRQEGIVARCGG